MPERDYPHTAQDLEDLERAARRAVRDGEFRLGKLLMTEARCGWRTLAEEVSGTEREHCAVSMLVRAARARAAAEDYGRFLVDAIGEEIRRCARHTQD